MVLVALASANSKLCFRFCCSGEVLYDFHFSIGSRFQKLSSEFAFISLTPLSKPTCPLYSMLYFVLKAWEFRQKSIFLVEQAK
jgi:hypothetical protein